MTDLRTIADLAKNALSVQDAVNLSGVVKSFERDITRLWEIAYEEGWSSTDAINTHPISRLYALKILDLAHMGDGPMDLLHAWNECEKLINETRTQV